MVSTPLKSVTDYCLDDNKTYVLDTESADQLSTESALSMTSTVSSIPSSCTVCFYGEQIAELNIGNDQLNIAATLLTIRKSENYGEPLPYNALYGGGTFDSYDSHPNTRVKKWGKTSTAAGAYQFLKSTWDEHSAALDLPDFSPASQDRAAVAEIGRVKGAMKLIVSGKYDAALRALSGKWTSLPGGRHQNTSFDTSVYLDSRATVIEQNR